LLTAAAQELTPNNERSVVARMIDRAREQGSPRFELTTGLWRTLMEGEFLKAAAVSTGARERGDKNAC